jgi:hypothetical protein
MDTAREKLAAIAETEAAVRSEGENQANHISLKTERGTNADSLAEAERRALWLSHRPLHVSDPLPVANPGREIVLIDDDGTPLETPAEMADRHRAEHTATVAGLMEGNPFLPACCPAEESSPCRACVTHEGPGDMADDGWMDDARWELGPDDDESFAAWIARQAEAFAAIGTPRAKWLAGKIAKLAEQARWLDAASPDAFDDRLQAQLDAAADAAEARRAASCC